MKLYMEIKAQSDFQQKVDILYNRRRKSFLDLSIKKCNMITYTRRRITGYFNCTFGDQTKTNHEKMEQHTFE